MISSAMPSQKYSWSFSGLMSAKDRIAIEGCSLWTDASPHTGAISRYPLREMVWITLGFLASSPKALRSSEIE